MKKRFLKFIIGLCVLSVLASCVSCKKSNPKPMLKVITSYQVGVTIFENRQYYVVYDNETKKRTKPFDHTNTLNHIFNLDAEEKMTPYLYGIDTNTEEGIRLNEIAKSIVLLTEEDEKIFRPVHLFVIKEICYFSARIDGVFDDVNDALFEYDPESNSYKKIASFNHSIVHVEAYE